MAAASEVSAAPRPVIDVDALRFDPSVTGAPALDTALYAENRQRLCAALREAGAAAGSVVLLQGSQERARDETDHEPLFRNNSHFLWASGVNLPDCYLAITVDDGRATLFVPKLPASFAIWMGPLEDPTAIAARYGIEAGRHDLELASWLEASGPSAVLLNHGINTDSGAAAQPAAWEGKDDLQAAGKLDTSMLYPILTECRVFKTDRELAVMRHINAAASDAHCLLMRSVRPGMREDGLEAVFKFWCQGVVGARYQAYTYICGSGPNAAILHYGHAGAPNDRTIGPDELVLCDCGHETFGYASDITTAFPSTGTFTPNQRLVYSAVLNALEAVEAALKPGVKWPEMQTLAYEAILTTLRDGGLLKGDVADMMAANLGAVFMPHGLGHLLGIDTHDVGGYSGDAERRSRKDGYKSLRLGRTLKERMVLTVEPGCYFIDVLLDAALADEAQSAFLSEEALAPFRGIGGVRLEDNVVVTATGMENMTYVPRSIDEVEAMCRGEVTSRAGFAKRYQK